MSEQVSTYINPLTDFGFKYIFGREADKDFTISFLNALNIAPKPIIDLIFLDKENPGEADEDRALIYDLHCQLAAVYGVFVMNFEWKDAKEQHLREDVCLYNMQTQSVFSDKMRMTFLKIPLMVKDAEKCESMLDRWIYILKNMEKMEALPQTFSKEPVFRKLGKVAKYAALTEDEKKAYKKSLKVYRDTHAIMETERTEGRAEGRAETLAEKSKLAREMGLPDDVIAKLFGPEIIN